MNKIDTISTAFAVVHTQKEMEKTKRLIDAQINELQVRIEEGLPVEGPAGRDGLRGPKGDKGVKGDQGVKGDKGERGERGPAGVDGALGPAGEKGDVGAQGIQGVKGDKGDKGERGEKGIKGDKGDTGLRGEKGERGETGPEGKRGKTGQRGVKGERGEAGPQGIPGPAGIAGKDGTQGPRGERGPQGLKGEQGPAGPAGPDYKERFEEALEQFNKQLTENKNTVTANLERQIQQINRSLSTLGGGGSYKIVDNADVDKSAIKSLVDDAVLIYDPTKKKFVAQSFLSILDRLKADLEVQYDKLVDEDAANSFTYVGEAAPGTDKSGTVWRIKRIYELNDGDLEILWANGTADFDKTWNDRATYTYSAD